MINEIRNRWLDVPPPYDKNLAAQAQQDILILCGILERIQTMAEDQAGLPITIEMIRLEFQPPDEIQRSLDLYAHHHKLSVDDASDWCCIDCGWAGVMLEPLPTTCERK